MRDLKKKRYEAEGAKNTGNCHVKTMKKYFLMPQRLEEKESINLLECCEKGSWKNE